ncbi:MAG TPA: anti-sigma factor [Terriglobia bacterium]|nr:anti-sigma factor [Terriglobia bacterium]
MNARGHPQFDEDFELYALGALDGEEKQTFELHLRQCPACQQRLARAQGRISVLGWSTDIQPPPAAVKQRLLGLLESVRKPEASRTFRVRLLPFWRSFTLREWGVVSLAAALVVVVVVSATMVIRLRNQNRDLQNQVSTLQTSLQQEKEVSNGARALFRVWFSPDSVKVTLVPGSQHPAPEGKAFYEPRSGGLVFYTVNLPTLPRNQTYQLWLVPNLGNPINAGIFNTDRQGNGGVLLPRLPSGVKAKAFAVTVEPAGGKIQPTGPKVLVGAVS